MLSHDRLATLIYNPNAGFVDWSRQVTIVVEFWRKRGWNVSVQATAYPGHAVELAQSAAQSRSRLVLVAGGDGTLHQAANGLLHSESVLAPLAAGTTNCLAKDLRLPQPGGWLSNWLETSCQLLADGHVQQMDVGVSQTGEAWLLWAGAGVDSHIVHSVEPRPRHLKRLGLAGYVAQAVQPFIEFTGVQACVTVDGQAVEDEFVMINVSNSRRFSGGLLHLNPRGVLDDGKLEVWLVRGREWPETLQRMMAIGFLQHERNREFVRLAGAEILVETMRPIRCQLDGEPAGFTPLRCHVDPGALQILVPACAPEGLFSLPGGAL